VQTEFTAGFRVKESLNISGYIRSSVPSARTETVSNHHQSHSRITHHLQHLPFQVPKLLLLIHNLPSHNQQPNPTPPSVKNPSIRQKPLHPSKTPPSVKMVSFKTLAGAALAAVAPASAYITGINAPATLTAGSEATITVNTSIYIQNW
jgi:hypothetical protein